MNEIDNKVLALFALLGIYCTFLIISLLVILTNKNPFWIKYKLKMGALILSLTAVLSCDQPLKEDSLITCYDVASNVVAIDSEYIVDGIITINSNVTTITGDISFRYGTDFSYAIYDILGVVSDTNNLGDEPLIVDNLVPSDGFFDEDNEDFKIVLGQSLPVGSYLLRIYQYHKDSIPNEDYYLRNYDIEVIE